MCAGCSCRGALPAYAYRLDDWQIICSTKNGTTDPIAAPLSMSEKTLKHLRNSFHEPTPDIWNLCPAHILFRHVDVEIRSRELQYDAFQFIYGIWAITIVSQLADPLTGDHMQFCPSTDRTTREVSVIVKFDTTWTT